jgi:AmmeMemoRadiSam system protein B
VVGIVGAPAQRQLGEVPGTHDDGAVGIGAVEQDLGAFPGLGIRAAAASGALVVASSDMSHYIPADEARERDGRAIERILALDPGGLHELVHRERISMCGVIPATVMLVAALELGATRAELVRYGSSGDVTGDTREVVGYAGLLVV